MNQNKLSDFFTALLNDQELRNNFKKNPRGCLKENGVIWEDKREIKVLEDTKQKKVFVIRKAAELNEALAQSELPENYKRLMKELQSDEIKAKIKKDPKAILQSFNIDTGKNKIEVVEDNDHLYHIVLPESSEIDERFLAEITGGRSSYHRPTGPATVKQQAGAAGLLAFSGGVVSLFCVPLGAYMIYKAFE